MKANSLRQRVQRRSAEDVQRLLTEYRQGGVSQRNFAKAKGIGLSTLQNWLRRSRHGARPQGRWLEVEVSSQPGGTPRDYRIEFSGGVTLVVPDGFAAGDVARLVSLLTERS